MSEVQQQPTGVPDGWAVVAPETPPASPPSTGRDYKILGVNIHVPGEEKPRADANVFGWGTQGAGVAPEDLLGGGMMARGVARAASGGAGAAVKAAAAEASPVLKYEITKTTLEKMHVPTPIAMMVAVAVSGYRGNGKKPAAPAEMSPAAADAARVPANATGTSWAPAPMPRPMPAEPMPAAAAPVAPVASSPVAPASPAAPVAPVPDLPPPAAGSPIPPPARAKLLASEVPEFLRLQKAGKTPKEALDLIEAQRAFAKKFGLPSGEQTRESVADRNVTGRWKDEP